MASVAAPAPTWSSPQENASTSWKFLLAVIAVAAMADFIFRGLAFAFLPNRTDFTELYSSAWLWRHGLNFYDSALLTQTATRLTGCTAVMAPLYPPTTAAAVSPLTYLPWGWAQLIWLLLSLAGLGLTVRFLLRIGNLQWGSKAAYLLATLVLAFDPFHQAFHLANIALLVIPLCLAGVAAAESGNEALAGFILAFATLLKPQLGLWFIVFYGVQLRKKLTFVAALTGLASGLLFLRYPISVHDLIARYQQNYQYWFGPGRPAGFTEGAFPFHVNMVQVVLYQLWHSVPAVKVIAQAIFLIGLGMWSFAMWRLKFRAPAALALASFVGLSFVSMYHSVSDAGILTLVLGWALRMKPDGLDWLRRASVAVFFVMLLPIHSVLFRVAPHLTSGIVDAWWWKLLVARYFVWLLLAFNSLLLWALLKLALRPGAQLALHAPSEAAAAA